MAKQHKSSYDKRTLFPLTVIKILFVVYILFNLFIPTYMDMSLGYTKFYSFLAIGISAIGVLGMLGRLPQVVPLFPILIMRFVQFLFHFILDKSPKLNIWIFIFLCILDCTLCIYEMMDRASYYYDKVKDD